jgi:hypothetical protein
MCVYICDYTTEVLVHPSCVCAPQPIVTDTQANALADAFSLQPTCTHGAKPFSATPPQKQLLALWSHPGSSTTKPCPIASLPLLRQKRRWLPSLRCHTTATRLHCSSKSRLAEKQHYKSGLTEPCTDPLWHKVAGGSA